MKLICLAVFFVSILLTSDGYKVLGVLPFSSNSHFAIGHSILKSLLEAGNEVTVISPYPQKKPIDNYYDVDASAVLEEFKKGCKKKWLEMK